MAEQEIELRKVRDFGQNFNDTFSFIRQNFKPLMRSFFAICGLFMLVHAIAMTVYQSHSIAAISSVFKGRNGDGTFTGYESPYARMFSLEYFILILFKFLTYIAMQTVIGVYFKFCLNNPGGRKPGIDDIWRLFREHFGRVALSNIPVSILIFLGLCLCFIPGIYLWVVWLPFTMVMIIEDATLNGAFNRCFELVREHFWISLAIYLVSGLIYWTSSLIIGLISGIVLGAIAFLTPDGLGTTASVITPFLDIFSFIFYVVFFVSAGLHYFTLVERRDGTGILSRIDSIGTDKNRFDNIEEQY